MHANKLSENYPSWESLTGNKQFLFFIAGKSFPQIRVIDTIKLNKESEQYKTATDNKQVLLFYSINQLFQTFFRNRIKPQKISKRCETAICVKQILFSCENSELCFCPTEQVPSDKNNSRFPPKSETGYVINSLINNCQ
jgi:hypothetical protein